MQPIKYYLKKLHLMECSQMYKIELLTKKEDLIASYYLDTWKSALLKMKELQEEHPQALIHLFKSENMLFLGDFTNEYIHIPNMQTFTQVKQKKHNTSIITLGFFTFCISFIKEAMRQLSFFILKNTTRNKHRRPNKARFKIII